MTDLVAIPNAHDLKTKFPGGSGGFSDGSIVCIRRTLTSAVTSIGPPEGKTWRFIPQPANGIDESEGAYVFNFDGAVGADVESSLELEDGTVVAATVATDTIAADTVATLSLGMFIVMGGGQLLTADMKLRFRLTGTLPTARVMLAALLVEYDMPKAL